MMEVLLSLNFFSAGGHQLRWALPRILKQSKAGLMAVCWKKIQGKEAVGNWA